MSAGSLSGWRGRVEGHSNEQVQTMGRNNQQRRAAKARVKAKRAGQARQAGEAFGGATSFGYGSGPITGMSRPPTVADSAVIWIERAMEGLDLGRPERADAAYAELAALASAPAARRTVSGLVTDLLGHNLETTWRRGWAPAELHRTVSRESGELSATVLADAMAHLTGRYAAASVSPRWTDELAQIGASSWWPPDRSFLEARSALGKDPFVALLRAAICGAHALDRLPEITLLTPVPGTWTPPRESPGQERRDVSQRMLERVRALLAKAESTTFEAEADTFTAGAQALMARHSIDEAMLATPDPAGPEQIPSACRIGIDRPYEAPKVLLLDAVATANRCRTVWSSGLGFVTVVGFEGDRLAVETLFTSLLVQATTAVNRAGRRVTRTGASRTRSFRSSFLIAFAHRIGSRLKQVTEEETERRTGEAGTGQELVRVLASRSDHVDDAVDALFPELKLVPMGTANDAEGWHAGTMAADAANLFDGHELADADATASA